MNQRYRSIISRNSDPDNRHRKSWSFHLFWRQIAIALPLVIAFIALTGGITSASEITLDNAVALALAQNPDLGAARQEIDVAAGDQIRAHYLSQFNPQFGTDFIYRPRGGRSNSQDCQFAGLARDAEPGN